jgi:hypothetical protein
MKVSDPPSYRRDGEVRDMVIEADDVAFSSPSMIW